MHSLTHSDGMPAARSLAGVVLGLIAWVALYSQLPAFATWVVGILAIPPGTRLHEAVAFFAYDTPKVLMLLTLVVFGMGVVRSFFSPERTRALLAGRRVRTLAACGRLRCGRNRGSS